MDGWHYNSAAAAVMSLVDDYADLLVGDSPTALAARYEVTARLAGVLQATHVL